MKNILIGALQSNASAKLQQTAGIGSDDGLRTRGLSMTHFFVE